jgi:hypothetical protein
MFRANVCPSSGAQFANLPDWQRVKQTFIYIASGAGVGPAPSLPVCVCVCVCVCVRKHTNATAPCCQVQLCEIQFPSVQHILLFVLLCNTNWVLHWRTEMLR